MNRNSNIQKMLNDELECFKEIHASSKLIADDLNEATNDTLVNLLIEREKRIKTITPILHGMAPKQDLIFLPTTLCLSSQMI